MPVGALWTLRYNPTVDGRILARSDAERLRADEFVQNVAIDIARDSCTVVVQFRENQTGPFDDQLRREIEHWISQPPEPQETTDHPTLDRDELISRAIGTPIQRRELRSNWAQPLRRNIDYSSAARRTFLVEDLSTGVTDPLGQGNVGSTSLEESISQVLGLANALGISSKVRNPLADGVPPWLKIGVWVQHATMAIAEVVNIEPVGPTIEGTQIFFKLWRIKAPVQSLRLVDFLGSWVQCEKPVEPTTRYERICKSFR